MCSECHYVLRHTCCTNTQKAGWDVKSLQYILVHSDASVTLNVYSHTDFSSVQSAVDRLAANFWSFWLTHFLHILAVHLCRVVQGYTHRRGGHALKSFLISTDRRYFITYIPWKSHISLWAACTKTPLFNTLQEIFLQGIFCRKKLFWFFEKTTWQSSLSLLYLFMLIASENMAA